MISNITLQNVRLFEGPEWSFPLKRLTLFCGTNSAGKSTLMKLPLLLKQTQESGFGVTGRLRMSGPLVDCGTFHSLVSNNRTDKELGLSITVPSSPPRALLRSIGVKASQKEDKGRPRSIDASVTASFIFHGAADVSLAGTEASTASAPMTRAVLASAKFDFSVEGDSGATLTWRVKHVKLSELTSRYEIAIPKAYIAKVGGDWLIPLRSDDLDHSYELILDGILPQFLFAKTKEREGSANSRERAVPLPPLVAFATNAIQESLASVRYLGPIRAPPKRYYISQDRDLEADTSGEALPLLLSEAAYREVTAPGPDGSAAPRPLLEALNAWLWYLRTGSTSGASDAVIHLPRTQEIVEFKLRGGTAGQHALADSGFGYSQVLPILVQGLLADKGDTLIVEQPELHLNPALQVRLVRFFLGLSRAGRQVLLETHSEHILNATRVEIAEDGTRELHADSELLYVGADARGPKVTPLNISENGAVPDWPEEFLGEAAHLAGRLLRAQRGFRKGGA